MALLLPVAEVFSDRTQVVDEARLRESYFSTGVSEREQPLRVARSPLLRSGEPQGL
jgi:hypothetical protein